MYIKNRRNISEIKAFGSYNRLYLMEKFSASKSPTFHILTVIPLKKKELP